VIRFFTSPENIYLPFNLISLIEILFEEKNNGFMQQQAFRVLAKKKLKLVVCYLISSFISTYIVVVVVLFLLVFIYFYVEISF